MTSSERGGQTPATAGRSFRLGPLRRLRDRAMAALLRRGMGPPGIWLLTVPGRRSGRPYSTPVSPVEHAGARWLVAPYGEVAWVRNVRAAGRVTLTRGSSEDLAAVEVGPQDAAPVLRAYVAANPMTKRHIGAGRDAPLERFAAAAPRRPVFRLG